MNTKEIRRIIDRSAARNITSLAESDIYYICFCLCDAIDELEARITAIK